MKTAKKWNLLLAAVLMVGSSAIVRPALAIEPEEKDEKVEISATPAKVKAAIEKAVSDAGGKLESVKKETEDGKTTYEAEFEVGKVDHSIKVSEAGEVLEEETEMTAADLPAAVTAAIKAKYASGKIEDVSLVKAGGKTFYEVDVEVGKEDHELKIDADGKVLSDKIEEEEHEEHEKGEKKEEKGKH